MAFCNDGVVGMIFGWRDSRMDDEIMVGMLWNYR